MALTTEMISSPASTTTQASTTNTTVASTSSITAARASTMNNNSGSKSSERIRSNLLHKLGIENAADAATNLNTLPPPRSLLGDANISSEPLKPGTDSFDETDEAKPSDWGLGLFSSSTSPSNSSPTSVTSSEAPKKQQRRLVFDDQVTVVPIPMRDEYSERVRERLWNNANEILYNAHRNSVEFAAEGWDWRNATEEEGMYECSVTGEKIHPVHVEAMSDDEMMMEEEVETEEADF